MKTLAIAATSVERSGPNEMLHSSASSLVSAILFEKVRSKKILLNALCAVYQNVGMDFLRRTDWCDDHNIRIKYIKLLHYALCPLASSPIHTTKKEKTFIVSFCFLLLPFIRSSVRATFCAQHSIAPHRRLGHLIQCRMMNVLTDTFGDFLPKIISISINGISILVPSRIHSIATHTMNDDGDNTIPFLKRRRIEEEMRGNVRPSDHFDFEWRKLCIEEWIFVCFFSLERICRNTIWI